ncbi:tetratricopeptide repeat-containing sensor histidine kinase [Flavobacterium sp. ZS1P14]|uniref:tetratricopeptide repeat-containing sensor histidine kinase n=1 Tax=Flavobacterium sp. ZS1P14 TaxID=3401729 RepID=UPI003AADCE33
MKKKSLILTLLLLIFFGCSKKESNSITVNSSNDSLSDYLSLANDFSLSREKRKIFNQKAFDIVVNQENDSLNRVNLFRVANRYYNIDNWSDFSSTVHLVLKNSESAKDTLNLAKGYTYLGDYYGAQAVSDSAFMYYSKAEKMYLQRNDIFSLARLRLNKALLQYNEGDFLGSEIAVFKALRVIKGEKANDVIYESYNLLGLIYNELGEYDKAIEFNTKALASIDDKIIPVEFQSKATSFNNIGYIYQNLNNHKMAISYFKKGLEQENLIIQKPAVYAMLLDNLAYSKFKLNEIDGLPQMYYQSLKLRDSLKLTSGIIASKFHLSEYFVSTKNIAEATRYSKEALLLSRSSKSYRNVLVALKQLAIIEPEKASLYAKEYIHINEELQKTERNMGNKFTRIEYETDQIKDENVNLETKNRNLLFGFSAFTILGMFLYVIKSQKAKNRELLLKQEQQKVNEEIYNLMISQQSTIETNRVVEKKRVAQELHDGVLGRMFGVRMNLDGLNKFNDELAVNQRISYLAELKNIEQDIREISHDLNREKSELINNFVAIVNNLFEDQKKTFKPKLVTVIDPTIKWELLSNAIKINLYRIIQESLQNINKYASANTIKVELKKKENDLFLVISDDGVGFNVNKAKKGIGLQNIQSRIKECDGTVDIKSKNEEGTTITILVPIEQKQIPT